jgi:ParB/Sulfiredoxin domain
MAVRPEALLSVGLSVLTGAALGVTPGFSDNQVTQAATRDLYSWRCPKSRLPGVTGSCGHTISGISHLCLIANPVWITISANRHPPLREGLPSRFRMRADAHYVEELDSALFSAPIRHLNVRSIDPIQRDGDHSPSADFVESVRRHGVLQPLLVRTRGGRFQVMAGSKRLAAALEAGLSEVPCLVERVDDDQARILAAATNVPSTPRDALLVPPERPKTDIAFSAFADCLTAVASSGGLLLSGSALTQSVAVDLVRAEAARALHLLRAVRVLMGEINPMRRPVYPRAVLQRVIDETQAERRLRSVTLSVDRNKMDAAPVIGDEELLIASIGALVVAAPALLDGQSARTVSLGVTTRADGAVVFVADHEGAELPLFWRSILAEDDAREGIVPGGSGTSSALTLLRAARHVAESHGGCMSVDCLDGLTSLAITIPAAR